MGEFSPWHLLILAAVFVLLFGAKKLPDAARSMGRSLRIFRTEIKGMHDDDQSESEKHSTTQALPPGQSTPPGGDPARPHPIPTSQPHEAMPTEHSMPASTIEPPDGR
jgi:sec-independent protein translocase protein TatA